MNTKHTKASTETLVLGAILTALVIVLQLLGSFIRFGMFSITLVLVPIVVGAAKCGTKIGAWLGFIFGAAVLLSGDAAPFLAVNAAGAIITVLVKGTACGLCAGLVYKALAKYNVYAAVIAAAIVCPVVNTGIFFVGCVVFFMETISAWGSAAGFSNAAEYMFLGLAGGNFLFELATNIILSPVIVRLLNIKKKA
jgi:thiamine transporter ThiT